MEDIVSRLDWGNHFASAFLPVVVENSGMVDGVVAGGLFAVSDNWHLDAPR
jgi:hypothetical protein